MHNPDYDSSNCLVKIIQDCEAMCEHMTAYVAKQPNVEMRVRQLRLLRDCADICGLTAKYVARCSAFAKDIACLCAHICEVCGDECAKHPDHASQHCAHVCMHCAKECYRFAMA
ncbi:four-helix bundle copper-binding protein [Sporomusa acidovorans]|uniref:Cysteine-rich protein YhjQ n=1 Tax=Sporomusa acidovorans (strain ATCC 49682 / DSM 3132 / Mol) TaxID=1123286 RepID=A0ABZ3IYH5_SPOA4|nr:four-helix bundle copper-binding protein [Sporomusa acidovorans]OZC17720.1 hypothetical protein SPACI_37240 [Sporomusa acidovorans DSM 3132]SDE12986.1 hypothetical protein SAMN04488499_1008104 [Sporomusa acidovorans]